MSKDRKKFVVQMARDNAAKWFDDAAKQFESAAEEMRRQKKRFEEMCAEQDAGKKSFCHPTETLSWAVNSAVGVLPNTRLDMVAHYALAIKAAEARAFGKCLAEATKLPVAFFDERFTTTQAEQILWSAGLTHKQRKARRDPLAAQIMLQAYLDAGCPADATPGPLEG